MNQNYVQRNLTESSNNKNRKKNKLNLPRSNSNSNEYDSNLIVEINFPDQNKKYEKSVYDGSLHVHSKNFYKNENKNKKNCKSNYTSYGKDNKKNNKNISMKKKYCSGNNKEEDGINELNSDNFEDINLDTKKNSKSCSDRNLTTKYHNMTTKVEKKDLISEFINDIGYNKFHFYMILITIKIIFMLGSETMICNVIQPSLQIEMKLNDLQILFFNSIVNVGLLLSSFFISFITNRYGRKSPIVIGNLCIFIFSFLTYFVNNIYLFSLLRVLIGFLIGIIIPSMISLLIEFIPDYKRSLCSNGIWITYPLGLIYPVFLGILLTYRNILSWRNLCLINSFSSLIVFYLSLFYEESPRYLLLKAVEKQNEILKYKENNQNEVSNQHYNKIDSRNELGNNRNQISIQEVDIQKMENEKMILIQRALQILKKIGKFSENRENKKPRELSFEEFYRNFESEKLSGEDLPELNSNDNNKVNKDTEIEKIKNKNLIKKDNQACYNQDYLNEKDYYSSDQKRSHKIKEKIEHSNYLNTKNDFTNLNLNTKENFVDEENEYFLKEKNNENENSLKRIISCKKVYKRNHKKLLKCKRKFNSNKKINKQNILYKNVSLKNLNFKEENNFINLRMSSTQSKNLKACKNRINSNLESNEKDNNEIKNSISNLLFDICKRYDKLLCEIFLFFFWFTTNFLTVGILYIMSKHFELLVNKDKIETFENMILSIYFFLPSPIIRGFLSESKFLGRKFTIALSFMVTSLIAFISIFSKNYLFIYLSTMNFVNAMNYGILMVYTSEYFNTKDRTKALAIGLTLGRVGGLLSPFVIEFIDNISENGNYLFIGFLCLLCFILSKFLKETRDMKIT